MPWMWSARCLLIYRCRTNSRCLAIRTNTMCWEKAGVCDVTSGFVIFYSFHLRPWWRFCYPLLCFLSFLTCPVSAVVIAVQNRSKWNCLSTIHLTSSCSYSSTSSSSPYSSYVSSSYPSSNSSSSFSLSSSSSSSPSSTIFLCFIPNPSVSVSNYIRCILRDNVIAKWSHLHPPLVSRRTRRMSNFI